MKKALLAIIATFALLVGSAALPSPASAAQAPTFFEPVVYTVGDTVSLDLGCNENNVTSVYYSDGTFPDGLSMDSQGMVTGVPTTQGSWTLSGWNCWWDGGSSGGYVPSATITFQINALTTPIPFVEAFNLNTPECSFYVSVLFPKTPDVGTAYVEISNLAGTMLRSNTNGQVNILGGQVYKHIYSIDDLNSAENFFGSTATTATGDEPFSCGDTISVTTGYQYSGAPAASNTADLFNVMQPAAPIEVGSPPMQRLTALNNENCEFRIVATLPTVAKSGSASITIGVPNSGGNQLNLVLTDQTAAGVIDLTFNPETLSAGPINDNRFASEEFQVTSPWECGTTITMSVQYRDLSDNFYSSTWDSTNEFAVTPTRPIVPSADQYSISASQVEGDCNVRVVTMTPNEARPIAIVINELEPANPSDPDDDGMDWITGVIIYESASDNGVITANLSFKSKEAITASVPILEDDKIFYEPRDCIGSFLVVIDSPNGVLASTMITLGPVMPTCNAGSILDEANALCVQVAKGFYTTELNSTTPIACPKGMTTATTASKSKNDCYKPLVQTISTLKAPKALKFGATTNLAITTNTKALAKYKVTGSCTAKVANITTKVKGKKVTTKMLKVTASKKAGTCSVTLTSAAKEKYLAMSKPVKIKVSKTGK